MCVRVSLPSVLGRFSFTSAAVECLRPFQKPLYSWSVAVGHCKSSKLSKVVRLVLEFLRKMLLQGCSAQPVGARSPKPVELFRTDAKAEGEEICIGGWAVADDPSSTMNCPWFSERLARQNESWAFIAGEPFRAISSLEMLATLVGMVVFGTRGCEEGIFYCSAATYNSGNAHVLSRLLTTKFPVIDSSWRSRQG